MADRPTRVDLLRAVQDFLDDLLGDLEGVRRFHARVASNALGIVVRELETEAAHLPRQHERLCALLGRAPEPQASPAELASRNEALEAELCQRIRNGDADLEPSHESGPWREQVLEHLRRSVAERLAVNDPGHR